MATQAHTLPSRVFGRLLAIIHKPLSAQLTVRQLGVLATLNESGHDNERTVRALAKTLRVSKPVIVRAATTLSVLGFVKRRHDPRDRRNVFLDITAAGKEFLKA